MVSPYDPNVISREEQNNETNLAVSIASGIGSGLIKIPVGLASVAAEDTAKLVSLFCSSLEITLGSYGDTIYSPIY